MNSESSEIVDIAFANMQAVSISDGPSAELLDATVRAATELDQAPSWTSTIRRSIAAIALITAAAAVALVFLRSPPLTSAQIIQKMSQAHLVQFDSGQVGSPLSHTTMIISDDGTQYFMFADTEDIVSYKPGYKQIYLMRKTKTAMVYISAVPDDRPTTLLDDFHAMVNQPSKDLGPVQINGRAAEKFVVEHPDRLEGRYITDQSGRKVDSYLYKAPEKYTIWADAVTGDLIRVEQAISGEDARTMVFDHFVLNPSLSGDELSTDIPKDYAVTISGCSLMRPREFEPAVVQSLREYASAHGGAFPPDASAFPPGVMFTGKLSQLTAVIQSALPKRAGIIKATTQPQTIEFGLMVVQNGSAVAPPPPKPKGSYLDDPFIWSWEYHVGKKLGDAATLIFWFKSGNDPDFHYRGIYADLSERDLPEMPLN